MEPEQSTFARLAPTVSSTLVELVCGFEVEDANHIDADYSGLFRRLRKDIELLHLQIAAIIDNNQQISAAAVFPFLCRKFLETSLTSILARIDPLRVLSVRKHQKLENYDHGKPNVSSISWTGDILPAEKPPNSSEIWDSASLKKGTERSLLGWHIGNAVFDPGLRWIVDNSTTTSDWIRKLGDRENPFAWIKGSIGPIYSTLSKGVHAEYLLDEEVAFDDASIRQLVSDSYMLVCLLSAATHATPYFARPMQPVVALTHLAEIERIFNE